MGCVTGNPDVTIFKSFLLGGQTPYGRVLQSPVWRVKAELLGVRAGGLGAERRKRA